MKKAMFGVILSFVLLAKASAQDANTGVPAPVYSGNGAPAKVCGIVNGSVNNANIQYTQLDATNGRQWLCLSFDGTNWAWFHIPSVTMAGTPITSLALGSGLTTTTICDTSAACPAGFYHMDIYINVTVAGTLGSLSAVTLAYTDETGATSVNLASSSSASCPSLSLITASRCSISVNFYKTAGTVVTLSTTLSGLGGTPKYNLRAVLVQNL